MKKFYQIKLTIIEIINDNEIEDAKDLSNKEKIKVTQENIIVHKIFRGFKEILTGTKLYPVIMVDGYNRKYAADSDEVIYDYSHNYRSEEVVRYLKEYKFFIMVEPFYFENPLIFTMEDELEKYIENYYLRLSTKYLNKVNVKRKNLVNMKQKVKSFKDNYN